MNIQNVAVIGAGIMGRGIAHVCALAGFDVSLNDMNMDLLRKGKGIIEQNLAKGVSWERSPKGQRNRPLRASSWMSIWGHVRKGPI